jgi:proteasome lid subunit RPN8/RPN11
MDRTMTVVDPSDASHAENLIPVHGRKVERIWYPEEPLFQRTHDQLIADCLLSDYECCGFIDTEHDVHFVPNVHNHPEKNYLMDTQSAQNALDNIYVTLGLAVLGIFHSHPHPHNYPWPSPRDLVGWPNPEILDWRYFIVLPDDVVEWGLA